MGECSGPSYPQMIYLFIYFKMLVYLWNKGDVETY